MTKNEIQEEAKRRYPIGTKFKSLYEGNENMYVLRHSFCNLSRTNELWFECSLNNGSYNNRNGIVYDFKTNTWAEIISYPEGYNPTKDLLKELVIW